MAITFNPCNTLSWRYFISMAPQMSQKFQTSKYETCFRIPLHISNFTKMFIKNLHTPHGEKKFSEQKLLQILQNNIIVIHANTHGKEKFLDIQAQNFINKQTHSKRNLWNCTYTPNTFFLHLSELSTAIQDNYPQKNP